MKALFLEKIVWVLDGELVLFGSIRDIPRVLEDLKEAHTV